jgi:hypothetical protein
MDQINSVVPRALTELFRIGPLSQGKLDVAWRVAVGDALSRVSTVRLHGAGVVEVTAADQRWRSELKRSTPIIVTKLNALLGASAITRLIVK